MGPLERFIRIVGSKLRQLGYSSPNAATIGELLRIAYLATMRTEEGRFVRGSLTFADPDAPDADPPPLRRADYPAFTAFERSVPLTVEAVVKLSRAIDSWCGSIAVHGKAKATLAAWGVLDQIVHWNVSLHRESERSYGHLGIFTVGMEGIGALSAYHGNFFLAGLRQDLVIPCEESTLQSAVISNRILPFLKPIAVRIGAAVGASQTSSSIEKELLREWSTTVARICIGLRRTGTGGALLISPQPRRDLLHISYALPYTRLGHAGVLHVLDTEHQFATEKALYSASGPGSIPSSLVNAGMFADSDAIDRENELTGAVRLATSLAAVDGLVLFTPLLEVLGFGVKIRTQRQVRRVYAGPDFVRHGGAATQVNLSRFGTRHTSMLQYCRADPSAIGVVVSQDGQVRLVLSLRRSLTLWENVRLLEYSDDLRQCARAERQDREYRRRSRDRQRLGYTEMPKTLDELMGRLKRGEKEKGGR